MNPESKLSLQELLPLEIEALQQASELLLQHHQALALNDLGVLQNSASLQKALEKLEQLTMQRCTLLQQLGFGADQAGLQQALEASGLATENCLPELQQALAQFEQAFLSTRYLLQKSQQHVRGAMQILLGKTPSSNNMYAANGNRSAVYEQTHQLIGQA